MTHEFDRINASRVVAVVALMTLAGCEENPRLQSGGAWNPLCLFWCEAVSTSADIEGDGDVSESVTANQTGSVGKPTE